MKLEESSVGPYTSSNLLKKVINLGLEIPGDLEKLAVVRGLRYYDTGNEGDQLRQIAALQVPTDRLSNAELAIAMLSPDLPNENAAAVQMRQRIAAAVLSASDVDVADLAALAIEERCVPIVVWIATCGADVEPENEFWSELTERLPEPEVVLTAPHPTRFVAMSGIDRGAKRTTRQWIRLFNLDPAGNC
ncbi:MAG: hypothetical protein P1U86_03510 [Verrucomicrobiales bacterium]|nr:hypothetical protein [Verrucomicrobiales bacterium]